MKLKRGIIRTTENDFLSVNVLMLGDESAGLASGF